MCWPLAGSQDRLDFYERILSIQVRSKQAPVMTMIMVLSLLQG